MWERVTYGRDGDEDRDTEGEEKELLDSLAESATQSGKRGTEGEADVGREDVGGAGSSMGSQGRGGAVRSKGSRKERQRGGSRKQKANRMYGRVLGGE